jgi:hypothetical protein
LVRHVPAQEGPRPRRPGLRVHRVRRAPVLADPHPPQAGPEGRHDVVLLDLVPADGRRAGPARIAGVVLNRAGRILVATFVVGCQGSGDADTDDTPTPPTTGVDSDADGLPDGVEITLGTDPHDVDTDDDTYTDRDEHHEGSDPLDATSLIYAGGWPYYYEKTELTGGTVYALGERFGDFRFADQHGDLVALWDFYNDSRPVIVELGGGWCLACAKLAGWLEGEDDPDLEPYDAVRVAVADGTMAWITIMGEDYVPGSPAEPSTVEQWVATFPNERIPVLLDGTYETALFVDATVWPTLTLLDPDLTVTSVTTLQDGFLPVLEDAVEALE